MSSELQVARFADMLSPLHCEEGSPLDWRPGELRWGAGRAAGALPRLMARPAGHAHHRADRQSQGLCCLRPVRATTKAAFSLRRGRINAVTIRFAKQAL